MGLWIELTDGTKEWLSDAEADAVCDALWSCDQMGAVNIVGKISHERRRPAVVRRPVELTDREHHAFRSAVDHARQVANGL